MTTAVATKQHHIHEVKQQPHVIPQTARVIYLHGLYDKLRESFNYTTLPPNVLITCGWTSRRARGKATSRMPAEFLAGEWKSNDSEAAFLSVHPERMVTAEVASLATLYAMAMQFGGRNAVLDIGLIHNKDTGEIQATDTDAARTTLARIADAIATLGPLPQGFAELPEPKAPKKQTTRMLKYVCSVPGCTLPPVRIASDTAGLELTHRIHRPYAPLMLATPPKATEGEAEVVATPAPPRKARKQRKAKAPKEAPAAAAVAAD